MTDPILRDGSEAVSVCCHCGLAIVSADLFGTTVWLGATKAIDTYCADNPHHWHEPMVLDDGRGQA